MSVWLTARGAGLSALVLLTITTCLGALLTGRGTPATKVVGQYVHRIAGSLGLGVLLLHIATILADSYAHVGVIGAVVPFTSGYRATWVGLGTIAAYLLVLVAALGFARGRLAATPRGAAAWRGLHGLGYAAWGFAMLHGFLSGTDSNLTWVRLLYVTCGVAVLGSVAVRLASPTPDLVRRPTAPARVAVTR